MAGRPHTGVSAIVVGLAGLLAGVCLFSLGGYWSARIDLLTHLAPLMFVGGMILLIAAVALPGRARLVAGAFSLVSLACSASLMAPELAVRAAPAPVTGHLLRLMTLNLWDENVDPVATARTALAAKPDVLVVEEATGNGALAAQLLRVAYPYAAGCEGPPECALAIYSRWPIAASAAHPQQWTTRPFDPLRMIWARIAPTDGGSPFTVVGTRYAHPNPAWLQADQRRRLVAALAAFDHSSLIVAGDFNSTPWSFAMRRQDALFGLERRTRALPTWPARWLKDAPAPLPFLPIDHVYAGPAWRTVSVQRGPRTGSDHYAVIATLARN